MHFAPISQGSTHNAANAAPPGRFSALGRWAFGSALALALAASPASAQTKLLRFPDIHADRVVFTYSGDLWTASSAGGSATRLTSHPGLELFAKFSPDGQWIAFTGQYDGDEQAYIMPAAGGAPRQLTFYPARGPMPPRWGFDNQVYGWTPDGKSILVRSLMDGWDLTDSKVLAVPVAGGLGVPLPMPVAAATSMSPDGKKVVYTPFARDFRTWKRYQGGWAQDLHIFDLSTFATTNITNNIRTDRDPMWLADAIVFNSDRTGTLNLYSYDTKTAALKQLTQSTLWDVRWPSADRGTGQVVYELNGELNVFDTKSGQDRHLSINVPSDGVASRASQIHVADNLEDFALSPKGERALFVARGDLFSTPIEKGVVRNLTHSSGAHDREAHWSPDGRWIAFLSDRSGEEEVYRLKADGSGQPEQLTSGGKAQRYSLDWSPDGKRIAFAEKDGRLYVVTVADKKLVEVARNLRGEARDHNWSPDGTYLAFSLTNPNNLRSISIWSAADGKVRAVTDPMFHAQAPTWDPKGQYLYYLSARSYAPALDLFDFNWTTDRSIGIYALALTQDAPNPFGPEDDKVTVDDEGDEKAETPADAKTKPPAPGPSAQGTAAANAATHSAKGASAKADKADEKDGKKNDGKRDGKTAPTRIDWDGLASRVARVPVPFDDYDGLAAADGRLIYVKFSAPFYGRESSAPPEIRVFTFKDRKATTLVEGADGYTLSADGEKLLVAQGEQFNLYDANAGGKDSKKTIDVSELVVDRVPAEEWKEVFWESWRRYRDYFYVANMHGYDWDAIGKRYAQLLPHVAHRTDLNYVIGEMIAELNVSHAYVGGGDFQLPPRPHVGLPGARFELDKAAGRYKIAKIFAGQNEEETFRSPLTEIGVKAKVGDYVLAIDGEELKGDDSPYRLLRHKADRAVRMTVNAKPTFDGAREITFQPVEAETDLIYLAWVEGNRKKVEALSQGRIGYIHIPDMGDEGLREFIKTYFAQIRKEGLVVDVRSNGGGNVSPTLLERLSRKMIGVDWARTQDTPATYPQSVFHGHMACIINEGSGSDGDIFPYMFRQLGLGPLIGTKTWGGVVGISGHGPLLDGTQIFVPEFASGAPDGAFIIEGDGVHPDIEVVNDPKSEIEGRDSQLERTVAEILKKIEAEPKKLPARPADPVKTQDGQPQKG